MKELDRRKDQEASWEKWLEREEEEEEEEEDSPIGEQAKGESYARAVGV